MALITLSGLTGRTQKNGQVVISGKNILIDANGTPLQLLGKDIDLN